MGLQLLEVRPNGGRTDGGGAKISTDGPLRTPIPRQGDHLLEEDSYRSETSTVEFRTVWRAPGDTSGLYIKSTRSQGGQGTPVAVRRERVQSTRGRTEDDIGIDGRKTYSLQQAHLSYRIRVQPFPTGGNSLHLLEKCSIDIDIEQASYHTHQLYQLYQGDYLGYKVDRQYRISTEGRANQQPLPFYLPFATEAIDLESTDLPIYRSTDLSIIYISGSLGDLTLGYIITSEVVYRLDGEYQRQPRSLSTTIDCRATDGATDRLQYTYQVPYSLV
eukprot:scaffold4709_cov212-Amphora_coffeaeformis.AAC.6